MAYTNRKGVTLVELLMVLAIVGTLTGLSLASYYSWKNHAMREAALVDVAIQLRQARNYAISGAVGSVVEIDPFEGTVHSWSFRPVELLSFDNGENVKKEGSVSVEENMGRIGKGAVIQGGRILLPDAGGFVGRNGLAVRFYIKIEGRPKPGENWIFFKGGDFLSLELTSDLSFLVQLGELEGRSRGLAIVPGRWEEITFKWISAGGTREVDLFVDSMRLTLKGSEKERSNREPLDNNYAAPAENYGSKVESYKSKEKQSGSSSEPSGSSSEPSGSSEQSGSSSESLSAPAELFPKGFAFGPFHGVIDEAVVLSVIEGKEYSLPGEIFFAGKRQRVYFAPSGGLDMRYHDGPVDISVARHVKENKSSGRTFVQPEDKKREMIPVGEVSHIYVELSGRIWTKKDTGTTVNVTGNGNGKENVDSTPKVEDSKSGN